MTELEKHKLTSRLAIIDRQVRGVYSMVLKNQPDLEILRQLKSLNRGIAGVQLTLLHFMSDRCLQRAAELDEPERSRYVRQLLDTLKKYAVGP